MSDDIKLTDRHREFLESVLEKKLYPFYKYKEYVRAILKKGYYGDFAKKQLNEFGSRYMKKYFKNSPRLWIYFDESKDNQYTYYKDE